MNTDTPTLKPTALRAQLLRDVIDGKIFWERKFLQLHNQEMVAMPQRAVLALKELAAHGLVSYNGHLRIKQVIPTLDGKMTATRWSA